MTGAPADREVRRCDECRATYFAESSQMAMLCPECAHYLYGYPICAHSFVDGRCSSCNWDGSRSAYVRSLIERAQPRK